MALLAVLLLAALSVASPTTPDERPFIGVNIGTALTNPPTPTEIVTLLKSQNIRHVRLFDADHAILSALANTAIQVSVSIPNSQLLAIGQSNLTAFNWVTKYILPHTHSTNITSISVGSEVLTLTPNAAPLLLPAIQFIHSALITHKLNTKIKVSTPISSSIILDSFPPSQAFFNRTWDPVMVPLLTFLQSTESYLMLNVYPYYDYINSNGAIPLEYALFQPLPPNKEAVDSNTLLHYTNVFDAVVDASYFAMNYLNFTNIPVVVTESGWPSEGDSSENANTYNSNLIKHVLNKTGTPKHPNIAVNTYIYELYNEGGWGLFTSNGVPVYVLQLSGEGIVLANDTANDTYCVVKEGVDDKMVQAALDWACGPGRVDCSPLLEGQPCYEPDNVVSHANYAFDTYYHRMRMDSGACYFNGVATVTTTNPSHGSCKFPGSGGRNGAYAVNGSSFAPSSNSTRFTSSARRPFCSNFWMIIPLLFGSLLCCLL